MGTPQGGHLGAVTACWPNWSASPPPSLPFSLPSPQNLLVDRTGRRVLIIGGYSLMAVWAVVFMLALALRVRELGLPQGQEGGVGGFRWTSKGELFPTPYHPHPLGLAGPIHLDALPQHGLSLCLHPELWHRTR